MRIGDLYKIRKDSKTGKIEIDRTKRFLKGVNFVEEFKRKVRLGKT